jgi:hypothetical protein
MTEEGRYADMAGIIRRDSLKRELERSWPRKCATHIVINCTCCGIKFERKRDWQRTHKRECQLILWYAEKFFEAFRAGKAEALRPVLEELIEGKDD